MKVLLILVNILFSYMFCFAQEMIDLSYLRCSYRLHALKDTVEKTSFPEQIFILQIGQNVSKYYSLHTAVFDSIAADKEGSRQMRESVNLILQKYEVTGKIDKSSFGYKRGSTRNIYKNYPKGKMTVSEILTTSHFVYEDSLNAQKWEITDSVKIVLGYECQKATTYFRGRNWIAWFAPDIPIDNGPWKLMGLPGLIMEAYDTNKHYDYLITGLEYKESPIIYHSHKYKIHASGYTEKMNQVKCTRKQFQETKLESLKDFVTYSYLSTNTPFRKGYVKKTFPVVYDFEDRLGE